ncbi:hypothetical protein [Streptomyces sp. NPDC058279]|uniref:hypothetical protein n=1 Tax=Streptomyces sp. NPDC058279 TaxID=3346418 RepID=UPI0036F10162
MGMDRVFNSPWTRKHDDPRTAHIPKAPIIGYPKSLPELIELCRNRPPDRRLKAAGSHWALSQAAVSDDTFIETNDPRNAHVAMAQTLHNVIPGCLNSGFLKSKHVAEQRGRRTYLFHVEAGKRIYQLYAEMDQLIDVGDSTTLAGVMNHRFNDPGYGGPWAFHTLGSAGAQTVVGALSTGTHGGDWDRPPLADAVMALHLVTDGGKHYWIERVNGDAPPLTDDFLMSLQFRGEELGGPDNFEIIRDNNVLNAVLVSAGRFGVIYSVVLIAVPQYALHERRRLSDWQDIKQQIKDPEGELYTDPPGVQHAPSRFLQIAVCLTPHDGFHLNRVGITRRWEVPLTAAVPGHAERVGNIVGFDPRTQSPLFTNAGTTHAYTPDPDHPGQAKAPSMLEQACADKSFLKGVIEESIHEIENFVKSNGAVVSVGIATVAAAGGAGLLLLIPALFLILAVLAAILDAFDDDTRLGEAMEDIKNKLLAPDDPNPLRRAAGVFTWQLIANKAFSSQQGNEDFDAISYAVMDSHDYLDVSCNVNVDSVEVFFDAFDDKVIAFVDALIAYETMQEFRGKAFVGYASLRFSARSGALIGMQKFDRTCSVEVACLRDVSGSQELVDYAVALARNPNMNAILHWGQRNDYERPEVERIFGDSVLEPGGNLGFWREALARVTDNGRLDGFSSEFTRRTGLEVVTPRIGTFGVEPSTVPLGGTVAVTWDCARNPSGTKLRLEISSPSGVVVPAAAIPMAGSHEFRADQAGTYRVTLVATLSADDGSGERTDLQTDTVTAH